MRAANEPTGYALQFVFDTEEEALRTREALAIAMQWIGEHFGSASKGFGAAQIVNQAKVTPVWGNHGSR